MTAPLKPRFDRSRLPAPSTFYERELGRLTRPSRGWARGNCVFHSSKSRTSFSVNLESGGFHCFGCDARGGDVLAFVRLRDKLDFKSAAIMLGCWTDGDEASRLRLESEAAKRKQERAAAEQAKESERAQRLELRAEIHAMVRIQSEISSRLDELLQGSAPAYEAEVEHCWNVLALSADDLRDCESRYMAMCGLEYTG